jgi:hypothetical protein
MYTFHASAAAYTEFWNNSFDRDGRGGLSRRQVWQAFVQESIRLIASASNTHFTIQDRLSIDEVTKEAFNVLGADGVIGYAEEHSCPECTHKFKRSADTIPDGNVADMLGMEQRFAVEGQEHEEVEEGAPVKMVVLDGIVMGHTVSFYYLIIFPLILIVFSTVHLKAA